MKSRREEREMSKTAKFLERLKEMVNKNDDEYCKRKRGEIFKFSMLVKREKGKLYLEVGEDYYDSDLKCVGRGRQLTLHDYDLDDTVDNLKKIREDSIHRLNYRLNLFDEAVEIQKAKDLEIKTKITGKIENCRMPSLLKILKFIEKTK